LSALVLFDVDGTLLLSGGAGVRAMTRAFDMLYGVRDAFDGMSTAGYTDSFLLSRALTRAGIDDTPDAHAAFRETYLEVLPFEIQKPGSGHKGLMPGVAALLEEVSRGDQLYPALLTGNYQAAAKIKLAHFGVADYFSWGAFGEDSPERKELARVALQRAEQRAVPPAARQNVVVIGDTPHDVACARAIGARAIAVATGGYSFDELQETGADQVVRDLTDTVALLRLL
jgi:phosphoglycolate phosphatase-like HAD superfamily hydrolase